MPGSAVILKLELRKKDSMMHRRLTALFALLALATPAMLRADHVEDTVQQLTGLNRALLRVLSDHGKSSSSGKAQLNSRTAALIANRAARLEGLIAEHADSANKLALPADLLDSLTAAFPESAYKLEKRGGWQGVVEIVVATDDNFSIRKTLRRLRVGSELLDLHFTGLAPEGLTSGDILRVQGVRAGNQVAAADSENDGPIAQAATCSQKTGDQKVAVLKITFPGVAFPANVTRQLLHDTFFAATNPSVNTYWQEVSAGLTSATASSGDVFPLDDSVYLLTTGDGPYGCNTAVGDYNTIRDAALNQATADPDFTLSDYDRIFFIHPSPGGSCWYGLGSIGCWSSGGWEPTPTHGNTQMRWTRPIASRVCGSVRMKAATTWDCSTLVRAISERKPWEPQRSKERSVNMETTTPSWVAARDTIP